MKDSDSEVFQFPVWKTITIGTFHTARALERRLQRRGHLDGLGSKQVIRVMHQSTFQLEPKKRTVRLARVSLITDLGFTRNTSFRKVLDAAHKKGLKLCPQEVGPQLRLQYKDQGLGEMLRIAAKPIVYYDDKCDSIHEQPCLEYAYFTVIRDRHAPLGEPCLSIVSGGEPSGPYVNPISHYWIFQIPKDA